MGFIKLKKDKTEHERVGLYIRRDLMDSLRELARTHQGESITSIVNQFIEYSLEELGRKKNEE